MKYALIAPNEPSHNGFRVAQVEAEMFEVAAPLAWVACDDAAQADVWFFDPQDRAVKMAPQTTQVP